MVQRREVIAPVTMNELEFYLLGLCAFAGGSGLVGLIQHQNLGTGQPGWLDVTWYVMLLLGGLVGAVSLCIPDKVIGLLVERIAMFPIGAGAVMYAVADAAQFHWAQAVIVGGFGVAAISRIVKLSVKIRDNFPPAGGR